MCPLSSQSINSLLPITMSFFIKPMSEISIFVSASYLKSAFVGILKKFSMLTMLATATFLFYAAKKYYSSDEKAIKIGYVLLNPMLVKSLVL